MRQEAVDFTRPLRRHARQHLFKIGIRVMPIHACRLNQAHDRRRPRRCVTIRQTASSSGQAPTVVSDSRPDCCQWMTASLSWGGWKAWLFDLFVTEAV